MATHGMRVGERSALWPAVVAVVIGAGAQVLFLSGAIRTSEVRVAFVIVSGGIVPALTCIALVTLGRVRGWMTAPRALVALVALLAAIALATATQLSWQDGFRRADEGMALGGFADAWVPLFITAWIAGALGIALFIAGVLQRTRLPRSARALTAVAAGAVIAPMLGFGLIAPTTSTVVAAAVAVLVVAAPRSWSAHHSPVVAATPSASGAGRFRQAARVLAISSAIVGVTGVVYGVTAGNWSPAAADGTEAMAQGIIILFASALPLLTAIGLLGAHERLVSTWGPIALGAAAAILFAVGYLHAPVFDDMAPWLLVSAGAGGIAIGWWVTPRLRSPFGARLAVGVVLGVGYAAVVGVMMVPMLVFAVPVIGVVLAVRTRPRSASMTAAPPTDGAPHALPARDTDRPLSHG